MAFEDDDALSSRSLFFGVLLLAPNALALEFQMKENEALVNFIFKGTSMEGKRK